MKYKFFLIIIISLIYFSCKKKLGEKICDKNSPDYYKILILRKLINDNSAYCSFPATQSSSGSTLGGTISGLTRSGLVLSSGTNPPQTFSPPAAATTFQFPNPFAIGTNYNVSITTQPAGNICTISNNTGSLNTNINNITITCETINSLYVLDHVSISVRVFNVLSNGNLVSLGNVPTGLTAASIILWNGKHLIVGGGAQAVFKSYSRNESTGELTLVDTFTNLNNTTNVGTPSVSPNGRTIYFTVSDSNCLGGTQRECLGKLNIDTNGIFSGSAAYRNNGRSFATIGPIHPSGNYVFAFFTVGGGSQSYFPVIDQLTGVLGTIVVSTSLISHNTIFPESGNCIYSLNGNNLYCANSGNQGNQGILQMAINASSISLLSPSTIFPEAAGSFEGPKALVLHPNGNFIFAHGTTNLFSYSVNQSTGLMNGTPISSIPLPAGGCTTANASFKTGLAIHSNAKTLYAICVNTGVIGAYPISDTGVLSSPTNLSGIISPNVNAFPVFVKGN